MKIKLFLRDHEAARLPRKSPEELEVIDKFTKLQKRCQSSFGKFFEIN